MSLIDEILTGRDGQDEAARSIFRKMTTRKPITEQGKCPEGYTRINHIDVRNDRLPVQGRLSADGEYACFETYI